MRQYTGSLNTHIQTRKFYVKKNNIFEVLSEKSQEAEKNRTIWYVTFKTDETLMVVWMFPWYEKQNYTAFFLKRNLLFKDVSFHFEMLAFSILLKKVYSLNY